MLIGGASMAIASMWASMTTWSTHTVLFCALNLVIATIFIASNFMSHNHHPHQLARRPSFLERVKSVNLSSLYNNTEVLHDEHRVQYNSTEYNSVSRLDRAPSLLQRVKSIDFSFSFYPAPADQLHDEHKHESEQTHDDESARKLARVPSILERVKSIKFSTKSEQTSNSIAEPSKDSGMTPANKASKNLVKSRSEKRVAEPESDDDKEDVDRRRPATMKASVRVVDESVDEKADDFIRRFKQQLKLQRIDSLKRFREMLNRGASSA